MLPTERRRNNQLCCPPRLTAAPSLGILHIPSPPLTVAFNYTQMETAGLLKWTLVLAKCSARSPSLFFHLDNSSLSLSLRLCFSGQLSGLGGIGQSSASSSWKPGPLDLVGRQRSSSDPPNMHPPVPPMRLTSTGGICLLWWSVMSLDCFFCLMGKVQWCVQFAKVWNKKQWRCVTMCPRSGSCSCGEDGGHDHTAQVGPGATGDQSTT